MSNYTQFRDTLYFVTPDGRVFSHTPVGGDNRFKKGRPSKNNFREVGGKNGNYLSVKVGGRQGIRKGIHHMVMECYGPPMPSTPGDWVVDHIDEDPHNNNITNLQWLTRGENVAKSAKHEYPLELREQILSEYQPRVMSFGKLAKKYDIPIPTIKYWYYHSSLKGGRSPLSSQE